MLIVMIYSVVFLNWSMVLFYQNGLTIDSNTNDLRCILRSSYEISAPFPYSICYTGACFYNQYISLFKDKEMFYLKNDVYKGYTMDTISNYDISFTYFLRFFH